MGQKRKSKSLDKCNKSSGIKCSKRRKTVRDIPYIGTLRYNAIRVYVYNRTCYDKTSGVEDLMRVSQLISQLVVYE